MITFTSNFTLESYEHLMADHFSDEAMAMALGNHCSFAKPWQWLSGTTAFFQSHGNGFGKPKLACKAMVNDCALVSHGQGAMGKL